MVGKSVQGVECSQAALAARMPRLRGTLAPVFWPRVRTCDLKRSPRYAFGRERALQGARSHGTKILERARKGAHRLGHW